MANHRPLSTVSSLEFKAMVETMTPGFAVPCAEVIRDTLLLVAEDHKAKVRVFFSIFSFCCKF